MTLLLISSLDGATVSAAAAAKWAWAVVRQSAGDHVPAPKDRGNSHGGAVTVTDLGGLFGPGAYGISFDDVGPGAGEAGNVLVSALGRGPSTCQADRWSVVNDDVSITVFCFTHAGAQARGKFIVNWLAASGTGGRLAYARNFSPTSNCGTPADRYHSRGEQIATCPVQGTARARMLLPELGSNRGSVQISAMTRRATTGDEVSGAYCGVAAFWAARNPTNDEWVEAQCFEADGSPQIYREHDVWFMQGLGMKGVDHTHVAYLLADRPRATSYVPDPAYAYSSADRASRVERLGKGRYAVTLPGMPKGGSAQVTPFGTTQRHCVITGITKRSLPLRVGVRCFDGAGDLADARFTLAYAR